MVIFHYFFVQRNRGRRRVPTKARSWRGAPRKVRGRRRAPTKVSGVGAECRQRSGLGAGRQEKLENKKNMSVITSLYTQVYSNLLVYVTTLAYVEYKNDICLSSLFGWLGSSTDFYLKQHTSYCGMEGGAAICNNQSHWLD